MSNNRITDGLIKDGHNLQLIGDPREYGGLKVACTCGWCSRVIGISDSFQNASLRREAERHIREADRRYLCHCGHEEYLSDTEGHECPQCHRTGQWMPYP